MPRGGAQRNARLEDEIRAVLADLLHLQVKDPRLADVTISSVHLSADRSHAKIYFSLIGDAERERQAADGFKAARAFLRHELATRMRLRIIPELDFARDSSFAYGDKMERLFDRLRSEGVLPPPEEKPPGEEEP